MKRTAAFSILFLLALAPCHAQFSRPGRSYVEFISRATRADYRYNVGEEAFIRVEALRGGAPLEGVTLYAESGMDKMSAQRRDTLVFSGGCVDIPVGTSMVPGFRYCSFRFEVDGKQYRDMLKVAFSPEDIRTLTDMPSDFKSFWSRVLKEAEAVPLDPVVTPLPKYSTDKVDVSLVRLTVGPGGRTMYGYLTVPKDGKKHPVLFCPPGAGANRISPSTFYSERGYIYFNVCIHDGLNPELSDAEFAEARKVADNYTDNGIKDPETFYYRAVYAGCSRCVDYLCTLPGWDGMNVGVTGGSQGGALTVVTSALNEKVTFASAFYPALCDVLGYLHGRGGGWPGYFSTPDGKDHSAEERTLQYYDVVNFGKVLRCPLYLSFGYADNTCSPTSVTALRNAVSAPMVVDMTPNSAHWRYGETNERAMAWQQALLK